jgi:translation initiation factor 2-alpha kinase 3
MPTLSMNDYDYLHLFEPVTTNQSRFQHEFEPESIKFLGAGGFGSVYRVRSKLNGKEYALKIIKMEYKNVSELTKLFSQVMREVDALSCCDNDNVVKLYDAWFEANISVLDTMQIPTQSFHSKGDSLGSKLSYSEGGEDSVKKIYSEYQPFPMIEYNTMENNDVISISRSGWTDQTNASVNTERTVEEDDESVSSDSSSTDVSGFPRWSKFAGRQENTNTTTASTSSTASGSTDSHDISIHCSQMNTKSYPHSMTKPASTNNNSSALTLPVNNLIVEKLLGSSNNSIYLFMQMQYCDSNDLANQLLAENSLVRSVVYDKELHIRRLNYFEQIVRGVSHLHSKALMHRDLKPSNIFIDSKDGLKIGDFGLARFVTECKYLAFCEQNSNNQLVKYNPIHDNDSEVTPTVGTPTYASPEQKEGLQYNEKTDIFSLGIILFQLLYPYTSDSDRKRTIFDLRSGVFPEIMIERYPREMELVRGCLDECPENRPSANVILEIIDDWKHRLQLD